MPDIEVFANVGILVLSLVTISDIYTTTSARAGWNKSIVVVNKLSLLLCINLIWYNTKTAFPN